MGVAGRRPIRQQFWHRQASFARSPTLNRRNQLLPLLLRHLRRAKCLAKLRVQRSGQLKRLLFLSPPRRRADAVVDLIREIAGLRSRAPSIRLQQRNSSSTSARERSPPPKRGPTGCVLTCCRHDTTVGLPKRMFHRRSFSETGTTGGAFHPFAGANRCFCPSRVGLHKFRLPT